MITILIWYRYELEPSCQIAPEVPEGLGPQLVIIIIQHKSIRDNLNGN